MKDIRNSRAQRQLSAANGILEREYITCQNKTEKKKRLGKYRLSKQLDATEIVLCFHKLI